MNQFHREPGGRARRIEDDAVRVPAGAEPGGESWEQLSPNEKFAKGAREFEAAVKAREEKPGVNAFVDSEVFEEKIPLIMTAIEEIEKEGISSDTAQLAIIFENLAHIIGTMDFKMSERDAVEDVPTLQALHASLVHLEKGAEAIIATSGSTLLLRERSRPMLDQLDEARRILEGKLTTPS